MNKRQLISVLLVLALVTTLFLVAANIISWIYFWVLGAALLIYVTYAVPQDNATNN